MESGGGGLGFMRNNDAIIELMAENGNMKALLLTMIPYVESRLRYYKSFPQSKEINELVAVHEKLLVDMREFTAVTTNLYLE